MVYPNHQLWALAVSAVITQMDRAHHDWIGGWGPGENTSNWCKNLLADYYGVNSRESCLAVVNDLLGSGHTAESRQYLSRLGSAENDSPKQRIVREAAAQIEKHGLLAWDTARAVMVAGRGFWAGYLEEAEAWRYIMTAAALAQKNFPSWRMFAVNYELGRLYWSGGKAHEPTANAIDFLLSDPSSPWNNLPFDLNLGVEIIESKDQAKTRLKRSVCPECGAQKTRPSQTAYVYCDYCGALADYDFQKARENPAAQPGPVYHQLVASLQGKMAAAKAAGDKEGFLKLQKKLYRAWAEACPTAIPPRAKDPLYRKKYISYMARAAALAAFDAEAERLQGAVEQAMAQLQWVQTDDGKPRVGSAGWERLSSAVFAQQEYLHELNNKEGIYARQPDGASPDLQLRIGYSLFAQGWLPMITEAQAEALLKRTGLTSEYQTVALPNLHEVSCGGCGSKIDVPDGARRTVCESCGFMLDVARPTIPCTGCGATLTPAMDGTVTNCPYCQVEIRCVN